MSSGSADRVRSAPIDALRALAALAVLGTHVGDAADTQRATTELFGFTFPTGRAIYELNVGVAVFFVISGFLVYRPFVAAHFGGSTAPRVAPFWWRRALRIYPAYWVAVTVIVAVFAARTMPSWRAALTHLSLSYSYVPGTVGSSIGIRQSWTLVMEASFYLLVPVWAALARVAGRALGRRAAEYAGVALLVVGGPLVEAVNGRVHWRYVGVLPFLGQFGLGMLLAVVSVDRRVAARAARLAPPIALWWLAAAAVYVVFIEVVHVPPGGIFISARQLVGERIAHGLVGFLLLAPLALRPAGAAARAWRSLAWLGVISYGFYLWHYAILDWLETHVVTGSGRGAFAALFVLTGIGAGLLGAASWLLLERPALRWSARRAARQPARRAARVLRPEGATTR